MNDKLSVYQNPEGTLKEWKTWAPRTNDVRYENLDWMDVVKNRTVLDLGCNNGFFTREAIRRGAKRAVGVDVSDCIVGARELAKQEGVNAEFWQTNLESKEFQRLCPKFEVVLFLSVFTHLKEKEKFLQWLDDHCTYILVFESNHGERNKVHIELIKKHLWFQSIEYYGTTDTHDKPHHLWVCKKWSHSIRYPEIEEYDVEWMPLDKIVGWDEKTVLNQKGGYSVESEQFKILLKDIKERGIREPVILQDEKDGVFRGFQGAHRYLAAKMLGYKEIPCKVLRGRVYKHLEK